MFFLCWMPELPEFWLFACITLGALSAVAVTAPEPSRRGHGAPLALALAPLSLWGVNLLGTTRFARDPARDYYAARIAAVCPVARDGDLVVAGRCWMQQGYLNRCCDADVLCLAESFAAAPDDLAARARRIVDERLAAGSTVFWLADAVDPEPAAVVRHGPGLVAAMEAWTPYRDTWSSLDGGIEPIRFIAP